MKTPGRSPSRMRSAGRVGGRANTRTLSAPGPLKNSVQVARRRAGGTNGKIAEQAQQARRHVGLCSISTAARGRWASLKGHVRERFGIPVQGPAPSHPGHQQAAQACAVPPRTPAGTQPMRHAHAGPPHSIPPPGRSPGGCSCGTRAPQKRRPGAGLSSFCSATMICLSRRYAWRDFAGPVSASAY